MCLYEIFILTSKRLQQKNDGSSPIRHYPFIKITANLELPLGPVYCKVGYIERAPKGLREETVRQNLIFIKTYLSFIN